MLERLNQAMEYIEQHLDQRIEVAELARIAVTSEYHFRRLFSALAGIPLSEYIRRRRLTVAGAQVLAGRRRCSTSRRVTATARARRSPGRFAPCTASGPARPGGPARLCAPSHGCPSVSSSKGAATCGIGSWRRRSFVWWGGRRVSPSFMKG
ncbi:hypothetical protein ACFQX6_25835 [Streptosporangium lutulentum]